jgi:hypothetical protein
MGRLRVVTWNGKDLPPELRSLPAGWYVVQQVEVVPDDEEIALGDTDLEEIDAVSA